MDGSLSGSSVHGIFQARILECVAISFSRGSFQHREWTPFSRTAGRLFTIWATREPGNMKSLQISSVTQSCTTLCDPMDYSMSGLHVHHQRPEFTQTHAHWVRDAIQPSHPLLSPSLLTSVFPSIRVFSSESVLHIRWPKYWSLSFSISLSNEYSGLISFRIHWLDLLAVQWTLKTNNQVYLCHPSWPEIHLLESILGITSNRQKHLWKVTYMD